MQTAQNKKKNGAIVIPGASRGKTEIDWLQSYHSFSFGDYVDRSRMGFGHVRVINDDVIAPASGFSTHGHRDMEIITLVLDGALQHQDLLGHGTIITSDDVQRMSAGTGILHSEFNASTTAPVHLLQIWVLPSAKNLAPSYEQKVMDKKSITNHFGLIAGPHAHGQSAAIGINQNLWLHRAQMQTGQKTSFTPRLGTTLYLHVAKGTVAVETASDHLSLQGGDALALENTVLGDVAIKLQAQSITDAILFEQ